MRNVLSHHKKIYILKIKSLLISFIVYSFIFVFIGEISGRIYLSYQRKALRLIFYGLVNNQNRLEKFKGYNGVEYYKSIPRKDSKNPVNSSGFRGPEIKSKKRGIIRIVCLGGSTTYGDGLDYSDTYPAILQQKLDNKFGAQRFEIINCGQPGSNLSQIVSFTNNEINKLNPDVVLLMSIENNFTAPGFWFADVETRSEVPARFVKIKGFILRRSALGFIVNKAIENIAKTGIDNYFKYFDWKSFAYALMSQKNIWQVPYEQNLNMLFNILQKNNSSIKIIFLKEVFNFINYPEMRSPFEKAIEIAEKVGKQTKGLEVIDICREVLNAAQRDEPVWQQTGDPTHLIKRGNEILSDVLVDYFSTMF